MSAWKDASTEWKVTYDEATMEQGAVAAYMRPHGYTHLMFAFAVQGNMVADSRVWYRETGVQHRQEIFHFLSSGCSLLKRIQDFEAAGQMPELDVGTVGYLRAKVWQVRHYHTQYNEYEALATQWRNRMMDWYRHPRVEYSLDELVEVSTLLRDWVADSTRLRKRLDQKMVEEWVASGCAGHVRAKPLYFINGNPYSYAFDDAAQAELVRAQEELNRSKKDTSAPAPNLTDSTNPPPNPRPRPRPSMEEQSESGDRQDNGTVESITDPPGEVGPSTVVGAPIKTDPHAAAEIASAKETQGDVSAEGQAKDMDVDVSGGGGTGEVQGGNGDGEVLEGGGEGIKEGRATEGEVNMDDAEKGTGRAEKSTKRRREESSSGAKTNFKKAKVNPAPPAEPRSTRASLAKSKAAAAPVKRRTRRG
ncbi:hypothetical protein RhiJN_16465 [Ceratobasidium sp. AG-Ba]|nr:hypothetical protein RhiJN_16465 [Ceratobasidium sp. AG-Ba]